MARNLLGIAHKLSELERHWILYLNDVYAYRHHVAEGGIEARDIILVDAEKIKDIVEHIISTEKYGPYRETLSKQQSYVVKDLLLKLQKIL